MGITEFVFEIGAAKAKIWGVFAGLSCCHCNVYVTKMTKSFLAIIGV